MKPNSHKMAMGPQIYEHISVNRDSKNGSKSSQHDKNSIKSPTYQTNNNSHHKISRLETNQSTNSGSKYNLKSKSNGKRIKTEQKSHQLANNSERRTIKKDVSASTKRLRTDVTERMDSPKMEQQRFQDDHNAASLAELLQFHTGYNDMDQQQFNYRVRKETEGSKLDVQRKESSQRTNSVVQVEVQDNDKTIQDEQQEQQRLEDDENAKSSKTSNLKSLKGSKAAKSKKSLTSNQFQSAEEDEDVPAIESDYTLGIPAASNISKQHQLDFKKKKQPKIRSYSHEDKLKIISQSKYTPKSQQELRMESRYLKGQLETIKQLREAEEMGQMMAQYRKNKKKILQQSAKKLQISKLMQNMKNYGKKSVSLPKIKHYDEIVLPLPQCSSHQNVQTNCNSKSTKSIQNTLSATRFQSIKKDNSMKNFKNKQQVARDIENVQYIENVLRSKGVQFDVNVVRKGLITLRTVTDVDTERIEYPRNLISNPKYQKYPL